MNTSKFDPAAYEAFLRAKVPPSADHGFPWGIIYMATFAFSSKIFARFAFCT